MQRREKILLAIFVTLVLAWQGGRLLRHKVFAPIQRSQTELATLDRDIAVKKHKLNLLDQAKQRIQDWKTHSLPPDPLNAQRLYQQWLTDLAQHAGFSDLKVVPERVVGKNDACDGVVVSIEAEATLDQLCLFLHRFHRTSLLHEITLLNIHSRGSQGNPPLQITVVAEALTLKDAPLRKRLFPQTALAGNLDDRVTFACVSDASVFPKEGEFLVRIGAEYMRVTAVSHNDWTVERGADDSLPITHEAGDIVELVFANPDLGQRSLADYQDFIARNAFAKPAPKIVERPEAKQEPEPKVEIDAAQFTCLVGTLLKGEQREAWVFDRLNNERIVVSPGEAFSIAGVEIRVLTIERDHVVHEFEGARWRWSVGKTLRSANPATPRTGDAPDVPNAPSSPDSRTSE